MANILFHCYGGIQRSSATLCAWLIYHHRLDCDAAIARLLRARPGLRPWRDRPHALLGFEKLETSVSSCDAVSLIPRLFSGVSAQSHLESAEKLETACVSGPSRTTQAAAKQLKRTREVRECRG